LSGRSSAFLILFATVFSGCQSSPSAGANQLVGVYELLPSEAVLEDLAETQSRAKALKQTDPKVAAELERSLRQREEQRKEELSSVRLEFKPGGTFELAAEQRSSGRYTVDGKSLTLVVETVDGQPVAGGGAEPVIASYDAGKRTLTIDVGGADAMVFQRQ